MIWFKYLWIVILVIYIIVLSIYTYFAFKDELERNRKKTYTPEDDIINPHKKFTEKYDVMQACSGFFIDHIATIGVWTITLILLFSTSIFYCFESRG